MEEARSLSLSTKLGLTKGLITSLLHRNILARTGHALRFSDNAKFMSADDAVKLIPDEAVLALSGLGGNQAASSLYKALVARFGKETKPRNLTLIVAGGFGARGRSQGSSEDLGVPGLVSRFIVGHAETFKKMLSMADAGKLEIQIIPQGLLCLMLGQLARAPGPTVLETWTGVGTFVDPRCGRGTPLTKGAPQLVRANENGSLSFSLPAITVAMFSAPAADRKGNVYFGDAAVLCESLEIAKAAHRNGGIVIVQVGLLVESGDGAVLPADLISAIVVNPNTEQTIGARYSDPSKGHQFLTLKHTTPMQDGLSQVQYVNGVLRVTPARTPADSAMARLAALILCRLAHQGMSVDVGTGLPEQMMAQLVPSGILNELLMIVESGVVGGVPCPGVFFGASVNPEAIISSTEVFQRIYRQLDAVVVGALEFDKYGNVNASRRGEGAVNYIGPGGFIDLTTRAKLCIFCCAFFVKGQLSVSKGKLCINNPGKAKFVDKVDEVTFNGPEALKAGKTVYYVTHLGAFQLTNRGVELKMLMPGVTVAQVSKAIGGLLVEADDVEIAPEAVVSGVGFSSSLPRPKPCSTRRSDWITAKL